jgi:hypothetical protein
MKDQNKMSTENKEHKVYLLKNTVNNKVYIGATTQEYKVRMNNGTGYRLCPAVYAAIKEYGADKFSYETLDTASSKKDAADLERKYIELYDSRNPEKGYNMRKGGAGSDGVLTEVGREVLSQSHSKETIEKRRTSRMETQEVQNQVVADYKAGMTINAIKAKYDFGGNGKVYRILDANKVERLNDFTKWTGKTHTPETKEKMSIVREKYWENQNNSQ